MTRGLSASIKTALAADSVEAYHLIRLDFSTPLYYTTAPYDISYDAKTFLSSHVITKLPAITETTSIKPNTMRINLAGADLAVQALSFEDFIDVDVYVYQHIPSIPDTYLVWQGFIESASVSEDSERGTSVVSLRVANNWSNWEDINNRLLDHDYQQSLFPTDDGLEFYNVTDYTLDIWGQLYGGSSGGIIGQVLDFLSAQAREGFAIPSDTPIEEEGRGVPVLYGERLINGVPVFRDLSGTRNEFLWTVYVLAEGTCDSLQDVEFKGISYTDAAISPYVSVWFHDGTDVQTADTNLTAASTDWTTNHRLLGLCYCVVRYEKNAVWEDGEPTPVFKIRGKKCFDPRTSTTIYTQNPAICLRDYLINPRFGKGLSAAALSGVNAAADYCDVLETDHDAGLGGTPVTIKRLQCVGWLDTGQPIKKNVEAILFTMRGMLTWANGLYHFVVKRHDSTSVFSFDEDNLAPQFTLSHDKKLNEVHYRYIDLSMADNSNTIVEQSASFLALDNNKVLKKTYTNRLEDNQYRAKNRAATLLKESRESIIVEFKSSHMDAFEIIAGDVIDITRTSQGWTNKTFRVEEMKFEPSGRINFKAKEYEQTAYQWAISAEADLPPDTNLLNPFTVTAPTSLTLTSGTNELLLKDDGTIISRIKATWTIPADEYYSSYNVYYKHPDWASKHLYASITDKAETEIYIDNVEDGITYTVYVTAVNTLGIESTELSDTETVIGKTAPPADVTNFHVAQNGDVVIMKWDQVADVDLAGYEIRYGDRLSNCCWDAAQPLTSVTRGTNVTSADVPPGEWIFYIKAVDTSGNYSTNPTSHILDVITERDVILQVVQSPNWTGAPVTNPDNPFAGDDLDTWTKTNAPTVSTNAATTPTEYGQAYDIVDDSATLNEYIKKSATGYTHAQEWCIAAYVKKEVSETVQPELRVVFENGAATSNIRLQINRQTGATTPASTNATVTNSGMTSVDTNWWYVFIAGYSTTTGTDTVTAELEPSNTASDTATLTVYEPTLVRGQWYDYTIANYVRHPTGVLTPQSVSLASLNGWDVFDTFVVDPYGAGTYEAPELDIGFDDSARVWAALSFHLGPGEGGNAIEFVRKYLDYKTAAGAYDGMELWEIDIITLRYARFQFQMGFAGGLMVVDNYKPTVDQIEHTQTGTFAVLAAGSTITFDPQFHEAPFVTAIPVSTVARFVVISSITATSFFAKVFDDTGTAQATTINWQATGI